ncbi:MAG: hypothetical protein NTY35_09880, partial [Planctomycetota bacterium]|nr:hypothetical protein [Planctomycetota bacterium]
MQTLLRALCLALAATSCATDTRLAPSWPGSYLLVAEEGALAVIEPNAGFVRDRFEAAADPRAIAVASNGQYAAVLGADGALSVVDLFERRTDSRFQLIGAGPASGLVFGDRRSTLLAAFEGSGEIQVVERDSGSPMATIQTGATQVRALVRAPSGRRVAAVSGEPDGMDWIDMDAPTGRGRTQSAQPVDAIAPGSEPGEMWCHATGENR